MSNSKKIEQIEQWLTTMWENYLSLNPDARRIYQLFSRCNNDVVVNDHIALRTFNLDKVALNQIAYPFLQAGFKEKESYDFKQKKLRAKHFKHPHPAMPKVFISELLIEQFSDSFQAVIHEVVDAIDNNTVQKNSFCFSGVHWLIKADIYRALLRESDYAAWVYALGYRPNHFTISVNHLKSHDSLEQVNDFVVKNGFKLNESGGLIKGTVDIGLKQSSTIASQIPVEFEDEILLVPGCFYEFAERFKQEDGELYQGFVAASADKIFESTDASRSES